MGWKDFYHGAEDKWYAFLDSLDAKKIPVYSVVDPIDKMVPSFAAALGMIGIILLLLILPLFSGIGGTDVVLTFNDTQERAISGLNVDITSGGSVRTLTTNSVGKIILKGVSVGSEVEIEVNDPQYQPLQQKEKIVESNAKLTFALTSKKLVPTALSFQFVDGGYQSLAGKTLFINLTCANGNAPEQNTYTVTNGILTLTPSEDCPNLVGSISGNGIQTKEGVLFSASNAIISLSTLSNEKGKIKITVKSAEDDAALENMDVELVRATGSSVQTLTTNSFGVAVFQDVPVDQYYVSVTDAAGAYALTTSSPFTLSANQTTPIEVSMGKQIQGTLSVSVTAKTNNAWVANATVKLIRKSDNKLLASKITGTTNTPVSFDVSEKGPFLVTATHTDYLSETKELSSVNGSQAVVFTLEKLTAQNSGKILIHVEDEDKLNVDNAQVMLYDAASGFLYHAANASVSDVNGNAKFSGIPSGTYFARATKYPAGPSDSSNFTTDKSIAANANVTLTIGQAIVQAIVKDADGNPIPFATVQFITDGTDECLPAKCSIQTDAQGSVQKSFKADRKIYVRASATGYTSYASASYQLYPAQTRVIEVKLPKTILGQLPKINFIDVKDPVTGARATDMKAGKTYDAVFQLQVPSALNNVQRGGFHIRVGNEELLENDVLQIVGVNAPGAIVVRGTSYQPGIAFEDGDELNLTNGEAKWINATFNVLDPGLYEISVLVRVSSDAGSLDELPFYYRAWVENDDDTYLRDPMDVVLGTSQTSTQKEEQYAETYQKIYFAGKSITCNETFCYSGENVLNVDDQLLVEESPYDLSINKKYAYSFVLTSNASTIYPHAKLRAFISNNATTLSSEAVFDSYVVTRPDGQVLQASGLSTNEIPAGGEGSGLDMGKLEQYKTIVGEFSFVPKTSAGTNVVVQLINEGEIIFEQNLPLEISSSQQIILSIDPTTAAAFIPTTIDVHVRDNEGFDVQDALVSLLKIDPNKTQQYIERKYTDITGRTTIIAPSALPNTHFVIDAVKGGYGSDPVRIIVDENVAAFTPNTLTFRLPNTPNAEQFLPVDITNQTQQGFVLSKAVITGQFQGLLSNGEMQNFVQQYQNTLSVGSLETKTIQVKASTSASVSLVANKTLSGSLLLTFKNTQSNQEWVQVVPFTVELRVVGECDEDAIQLSGTPASGTLSTTAFDNKSQTPFQIANTCHVDGQPFQLKNLKAKVVWKSNPIGNIELAATDIEGSEQAVEVLRSSTYTTLFDAFKTADESTYESILTFTPFPQNIGQTADFTVFIAGELGSGNNVRTVSESFDVKIKVTNLETCVKFDPEPEEEIVLKREDNYVEFEVDTSACGSVPVDIFFCTGSNNSNCSGGAPEGRLFLSQYSINNLNGDKTIRINRQGGTLPGSYDLTVDASVPGVSPYRIAALNVKVESDSSYAFEMEKSDFSLYQKNAKDATTVINSLVAEKVSVKANKCDWESVASRPFGQNLGMAAGIGAATYVVASYAAAGTAFGFTSIQLTSTIMFSDGCVPCLVVAVVAAVAYLLYETFDDKCDGNITGDLPDYIINLAGTLDNEELPPDSINILLSSNVSSFVKGEWNTDASNYRVNNAESYDYTQTVGAVFTNLTGYSNPNPLFGVATLRAREHIHGDVAHAGNARVECGNDNFSAFKIGPSLEQGSCSDAVDTVREEKFHVKFKTQDVNQSLPKLNFDSVACVSGTTLGATGSGSIPKVAFNWSWNDTTGIPLYACDASNPNAIYCDATQLNIDIMKRVKALDDFLAANQYTFDCPDNPALQPDNAQFPATTPIPSGFVGMAMNGYDFVDPTTVQFLGTVQNNSTTAQTVTFAVDMVPFDNATSGGGVGTKSCTVDSVVNANMSASVTCTISGLAPKNYTTKWGLSSTTTTNIAYSSLILNMDVQSYGETTAGTCDSFVKTTAILNGVPGINMWIDAGDPRFASGVNDTSVTYTAAVPNVHALEQLMHFDAYLIRDGYSTDFENDFRDYYSTGSFADAPAWFKGSGSGVAGYNAFYGEDDRLVFSNKYFSDSTLPAPGKYRVDIGVFFGDEWRIMDTNGRPSATIGVDFYHLKNPVPNSPFYKLPFNGHVGLVGTQYSRVGYGLEYINETNPIKVNDSTVQTYSGEESSAMAQANVEYEDDLRTLNSIPSTRGNILEITASSGNTPARIVFSPSLATPTVMKISKSATTQPFSTFYHIAENGTPIDTGNTLTYWEGAGNCYDYTSVPVYEKFNYSPDRAATNEDKLNAWQYSYAIDWPFARVGGNEYLRTILYTPARGSYSIVSESDTTKFFTTNTASASTSQTLDGINTLPYNNASTVMDSMQDVFDLVSSGKICVTDSGNKARFFWNPETLYKQTSQTSVSAFTNGLVAGQTCVGAPTNG